MGGKPQPTVPADYSGIGLQNSAMSLPVPLAWGLTRGAPNLIDYTDFKVHKKTVGKGGVLGKGTEYTYSATIVLALCEGPITEISKTYVNQGFLTGYTAAGFAKFNGTTPQSPWPYMAANHPERAYSYQGIAYLGGANYDLGTSETIPNLSFEIEAPLYNTGYTGAGDADCALVVQDFLTNEQYGANFPTARIDTGSLLSGPDAATTGDSAYQTYCRAMGWGFSPFLASQEAAISVLARWMQITNTAPVWTGYSLQFVPFGDQPVTGNGVTYVPPTAAAFSFGDDDWLQDGSDDPLQEDIVDPYDASNALAIECSVRANDYNPVPIDDIDLNAVDSPIGRRQASNISAREICDTAMAQAVVSLILARMMNIRSTWTGKLGPRHARRLPMEVGFITRGSLVNQPVRIRSIGEDDDGELTFVFEEFPGVVGQPKVLAASGGTGAPTNSQVAPASVNAPLIFEPNAAACAFLNNGSSAALIVAVVSGGDGTSVDPNWGGCVVWVSTDGTTYAQLNGLNGSSEVQGPGRQGVLTAALASYGGANPDTTDTLSVSTALSGAELASASSSADAAAGATLCVIKEAGGAYELLGPETATVTGASAYDLTSNWRGLFGTAPGAHISGGQFARLDGSQFMAALPADYIGRTLYLKFQSFNIWNNALQDLSTCTAYAYTPAGTGYGGGTGGAPTTPTGLSAPATGPAQIGLSWTANPATDNVDHYVIYRANGTGASFGSASQVGTSGTANYADTGLPSATGYTYFVEAVNAIGPSSPSAGANGTTSSAGFGGATDLATAAEALTAGMVVNLFDSSGAMKAQKANATDLTKPAHAFVLASASSGAAATVYLAGQYITGLSGLSPGATYYLDTTAGGITATAPSTVGNGIQELGQADSTGTKLFFNPKPILQVV